MIYPSIVFKIRIFSSVKFFVNSLPRYFLSTLQLLKLCIISISFNSSVQPNLLLIFSSKLSLLSHRMRMYKNRIISRLQISH